MASTKWLTNSLKAGIVTAVIGAIGAIASAAIGRPSCPPPPPDDPTCTRIVAYAGQLESQGKAISPAIGTKLSRCLGVAK